MARRTEITVDTTLGTLVARAGDDFLEEPDINLFLRDEKGRKMVLVRVSDGTACGENGIRIGVFRNVASETPAEQFVITKRQLRLPCGCWKEPEQ